MDTVRIFDTTLRDGEQSPGRDAHAPGKAGDRPPPRGDGRRHHRGRVPHQLRRRLRVRPRDRGRDRPTASSAAWPAATPKDIDRAGEAVKHAQARRIHVFCATSKIHREHKLRKGKRGDHPLSVESIKQALRVHRRRRVQPRGRQPDGAGVPGGDRRRPPSRPARRRSTCPTPSATPRRRATARSSSHLLSKLPDRCRSGDRPLVPLPQRPGPGRRQLAGGGRERRAAGRVHDQRHRRARGQRGAGRDRHGPARRAPTSTRSARASTRRRSTPPAGWSAR